MLLHLVVLVLVVGGGTQLAFGLDCNALLQHEEVTKLSWDLLSHCLQIVGSENLSAQSNSKFWRLVKDYYQHHIEYIPAMVYAQLGYVLTAIPIEDIQNITMESVDVVQAFGAVRNTSKLRGLSGAQLQLIANKTREEWVGKNPRTYSEYDLRNMGAIVCYLPESDIADLQPVAFRVAINWIGRVRACPRVKALAQIAKLSDVFGPPAQWNKYQVSFVGNIINGLTTDELYSINEDILHVNIFLIGYNLTTSMWHNQTRNATRTLSGTVGNVSSIAGNVSGTVGNTTKIDIND